MEVDLDIDLDIDLDAAVAFVGTHARVLDRRRLALLLGTGSPGEVLAALDGYRNPDGGYGWGLEPDLRSVSSQPVGAMHALEVLAEAAVPFDRGPFDRGPVDREPAAGLLGWLQAHTNPDGGVPFALPFPDTDGCAPHWVAAGSDGAGAASSLQLTAQLAAQSLRVPGAGAHPWTSAATAYCLDAIEHLDGTPHAYEVLFALAFLDALGGARAADLAAGLAKHLNGDGPTPVTGGAPDEVLHPIDFAPRPGTPARAAFGEAAIAADLARLAGEQQDDGGWAVGFPAFSPAAALEWRGYRTVQVLRILRDNAARR